LSFHAWSSSSPIQQGTLDHGLHINSTSPTSLTAYSDADGASCPDTHRSTSGYCVSWVTTWFLGP
jgi:hypothetical protein